MKISKAFMIMLLCFALIIQPVTFVSAEDEITVVSLKSPLAVSASRGIALSTVENGPYTENVYMLSGTPTAVLGKTAGSNTVQLISSGMKNSGEKTVAEVDVYSCVSGQGFSLRCQHYTSTGANAGEALSISFISGEHLTLNKWHRISLEMSYDATSNSTVYKGYVDGELVITDTLSDSYNPRMIRLVPFAPSTSENYEGYFKNPYVYNSCSSYDYVDNYSYSYADIKTSSENVIIDDENLTVSEILHTMTVGDVLNLFSGDNLKAVRVYTDSDSINQKADTEIISDADILAVESTDGLISLYDIKTVDPSSISVVGIADPLTVSASKNVLLTSEINGPYREDVYKLSGVPEVLLGYNSGTNTIILNKSSMKNSSAKTIVEIDVYSCVIGQGFTLMTKHYTSTGGNDGASNSVTFKSDEHFTPNEWHRISLEISYNATSNITSYNGYVDGKLVTTETLSDSYKPRLIRLLPYSPSTFVSFEGYFKNPYIYNTSNYYDYADKYDYTCCELSSKESDICVYNDEKLIAGLPDNYTVADIKDNIYSSNLSGLRIYSKDEVLSPKEDSDTVELSDILVAESTDGLISVYSFVGNAELKLDIRSEKIVAETTFERADLKGEVFNIYLASYDESGKLTDLKMSPDEIIKDTLNSMTFEAELPDSAKRIGAFLWTKDGMPLSKAEFMDVKTIKIFGIGNSYTIDATAYLYPLLKEAGYNNIVIAHSHIDSSNLEMHWNNVVNDSAVYDYRRDDCGEWKVQEKQKIYDILVAEDWDIITLQQVSARSGMPETYEDYLTNLINWVNENKTNKDAKLYFYMTWAYEQGFERLSYYDNDQMAMYNAIISAIRQVVEPHKEFAGIIPVGTAVQNMRTSLVGDTMNRDGTHIQYGYGRYTLALSWIKTLTEYNTDNLTYNPNPKYISQEIMLAAKEAVNNAYNTPYAVTASSYPPVE